MGVPAIRYAHTDEGVSLAYTAFGEGPPLLYVFADELGAKYGALDLRNMDRPGERRREVTVTSTRVRAVDMREPGTVGSSLNR